MGGGVKLKEKIAEVGSLLDQPGLGYPQKRKDTMMWVILNR